jgi:MFS family permease
VIRRPTLVLALLTALNLLNFIDRYVLAAVLPKVRDTLHLSNFVSGLMATVFLAGYFLTSPIFGVLGDRMRRTWLITFGIVVWSIATFASGLAQGATSMLVCRALVGVGEASFTAIAPTLIDDVTPKDKKGKYLAIFYVAQPIGAALGYLLGGALEKAYGWRAAFYFAGGPGLVLALTCLLIAEPDRGVREKADVRKAFGELWASRQYRRAILGYCAYTFAIGGFSYWAPTFLSDTFHIDLAKANFRFGLLTVVGGAIGTFVGGSFADRMQKTRGRSRGAPRLHRSPRRARRPRDPGGDRGAPQAVRHRQPRGRPARRGVFPLSVGERVLRLCAFLRDGALPLDLAHQRDHLEERPFPPSRERDGPRHLLDPPLRGSVVPAARRRAVRPHAAEARHAHARGRHRPLRVPLVAAAGRDRRGPLGLEGHRADVGRILSGPTFRAPRGKARLTSLPRTR